MRTYQFPKTFTRFFTSALIFFTTFTLPASLDGCITNTNPCRLDGSLGYCCSNFCLVKVGESAGICTENKSNVTPAPVTPVPNPECIKDGKECDETGNGWMTKGSCCSGFCLKGESEKPAKCLEGNSSTRFSSNGLGYIIVIMFGVMFM